MARDFAKELENFSAVWDRVCGGAQKQAGRPQEKQRQMPPQKVPETPGLMPGRGKRGPDSPFRPRGR